MRQVLSAYPIIVDMVDVQRARKIRSTIDVVANVRATLLLFAYFSCWEMRVGNAIDPERRIKTLLAAKSVKDWENKFVEKAPFVFR